MAGASLRPIDNVVNELHAAWTAEADLRERLRQAEQYREDIVHVRDVREHRAAVIPPRRQQYEAADDATKQAAAEVTGFPVDGILAGNGSDELLSLIVRSSLTLVGRSVVTRPA